MRLLALLPVLLVACAPTAPPSRDAILAIGDSIMAWNGDAGIPEAVGQALGRPVVDRSRSGAHLSHPNGIAAALGFDISRQFTGGDWNWVLLTAGANDLRGVCGTPEDAPTRDALIGADLTGEIPTLIARLRAAGSRVAVLGYYDGVEGATTGFTPCQPSFDVINARMAQLAARTPGVIFFDAGDVIVAGDRSLYAGDLIHPSPRASARIGSALARAMRAAE